MPLISQFYGILIYMYRELGGHHNEPHIHINIKYVLMNYTIMVNKKYKRRNNARINNRKHCKLI